MPMTTSSPGLVERSARRSRFHSRAPQALLLAPPVARALRWGPLLASGAAGGFIVWVLTKEEGLSEGGMPIVDVTTRIQALRISALLLALGTAFLLDDPARPTTDHLPTPLWFHRVLRLTLTVPVAVGLWVIQVWLARQTDPGLQPLPIGDVSLEAASLVALSVALAAGLARFVPDGMGGVAAGPALLVLVGSALFLPPHLGLFPLEAVDPRWQGAHDLWKWLLVGSLGGLVWASLDPGRPPLLRRRPENWPAVRTPVDERSRGSRTPPAPSRRSGTLARSSSGPGDP
jgi:fluoroquinolone transport system permease protein